MGNVRTVLFVYEHRTIQNGESSITEVLVMTELCPIYAVCVDMHRWTDIEFMNAGIEHILCITYT